MMNKIKMKLKEGTIKIPSEVINELKLKEGDNITIEYQGKTVRDHCFSLESDYEENMFDEGFYCIPNRLITEAGLKEDEIDVVINDNEIVLTQSKENILASAIECIKQLDSNSLNKLIKSITEINERNREVTDDK